MSKKFAVSTPLAVIGAFVALVEGAVIYAIPRVSGNVQVALTNFFIVFALLIAAAFFAVLWFRPWSFYPPSEYGEHAKVGEFINAFALHPTPPRLEGAADKARSLEESKITDASVVNASDIVSTSDDTSTPPEPKQPDLNEWLSAWAKRDFLRARDLLSQDMAASQSEDTYKQRLWLAEINSHLDFNSAINQFEVLIKERPDYGLAYSWFADIYAMVNLINKELEVIDRGISAVSPADMATLQLRKVQVLIRGNRTDEAVALIEQLVATNTTPSITSHAFRLLAEIQKKQDKTTEATDSLLKAYRADPSSAWCLQVVAEHFESTSDIVAEIFFRNLMVELFPDDSGNWGNLGNAQVKLLLHDSAIQSYEKGIKLADSKPAWLVANIGNAFNNANLYTYAIAKLQEAVEIMPTFEYAHKRLAEATKAKEEQTDEWKKKLAAAKLHVTEMVDKLVLT